MANKTKPSSIRTKGAATTKKAAAAAPALAPIERVQTGIRIEKRLLKVLKALAEFHDMTLGDLLEGVVLHAFDGKVPFDAATLAHVVDLKRIYGLDLTSQASHRMSERS